MARPGPTTGHRMKLYLNDGTVATPSWTLIDEVTDVSIPDLSVGLAELKRRASNFTKNLVTIMQPISLEFRMHHGLDDAMFTTLRTMFFASTPAEWASMDQEIATAGSEGLRCPFVIADFPWDQPLEDVNGHDIRLAIAYMIEAGNEIEPSWMVVSV